MGKTEEQVDDFRGRVKISHLISRLSMERKSNIFEEKPYFAYYEPSLQPSPKGIYVQLFGNGKEKKIFRPGEGIL